MIVNAAMIAVGLLLIALTLSDVFETVVVSERQCFVSALAEHLGKPATTLVQ